MEYKFNYRLVCTITLIIFSNLFLLAQETKIIKYVGAEACGKCHKSEKQGRQLLIWQESLHANAYKELFSNEAIKIAKEMGFEKPPHQLNECLVCHASGFEVDESKMDAGFKIEDGVQCETCHGAGSEYKSIKVMKDRKIAMQNGLVNVFENTEEFCTTCHNPDSPTFAGFEFETMWAKIEHYLPVKNKEK